mmetsp:Transcript_27969/g.37338  ORF Transcript_27969/g.37338 Transcript_27969/m.37338 type:complete len:138 (+) Transcript_27969:350-763(+)
MSTCRIVAGVILVLGVAQTAMIRNVPCFLVNLGFWHWMCRFAAGVTALSPIFYGRLNGDKWRYWRFLIDMCLLHLLHLFYMRLCGTSSTGLDSLNNRNDMNINLSCSPIFLVVLIRNGVGVYNNPNSTPSQATGYPR